jgi:hypothetical protein
VGDFMRFNRAWLLFFSMICSLSLTACDVDSSGGYGLMNGLRADGTLNHVKVMDKKIAKDSDGTNEYYVTFGKGTDQLTFHVDQNLYNDFHKNMIADIGYNNSEYDELVITNIDFPYMER